MNLTIYAEFIRIAYLVGALVAVFVCNLRKIVSASHTKVCEFVSSRPLISVAVVIFTSRFAIRETARILENVYETVYENPPCRTLRNILSFFRR